MIKRAKNEYKILEFLKWVSTMKCPLAISESEILIKPKIYAETQKQRILHAPNQQMYNHAINEIFRVKQAI